MCWFESDHGHHLETIRMFTADMARDERAQLAQLELDRRIEAAVKESRSWGNRATVRVYHDDPFVHTIREELEKRGFSGIVVPDITLCGDVSFEW